MERSAKESGVLEFKRLRFSRQEAEAITALAPGEKSLKAIDFAAKRATAELIKRFYRAMFIQGKSPAAALRAAQTSLRREKGWAAPYYWAGFTLQGEWR